jgi:hypothetical protein
MRWRIYFFLLALAVVAAAIVVYLGCSADSTSSSNNNTVTVNITVLRDDLFGLNLNQVIGQAQFNPASGDVGVNVQGQVYLATLSRFPNQQINVAIELENQDAARQPWTAIQWVQQGNLENTNFPIPLVETIPTLLNFRVHVYYYQYANGTTSDDDSSPIGAVEGSPVADDDASPTDDDDDNDDDASPADDDASPADDDSSPADDDSSPSKVFDAEGVFLFLVNRGQPSTGN